MRRLTLVLPLLLFAAVARADDSTALVGRWAAAVGGIDKLRAVGTIHRIEDVRDDGTPGVRDEWITPALARRELLDHTADRTLEVFDGKTAWRRDWNGFVEQLAGVDAPELAGDNPVRFHPAEGLPLTFVLDPHTSLPLRAEMPSFDGVMTIAFSDWRDVNGIRVPFAETLETGPTKSESHLRSIDLNAAMSEALTRPESGPDDTFFLHQQPSERIPFNFDNNHIMILGTVNGFGPIWLLVDTGAEFSLLNQSRLDELHAKAYGGLQTIGGGESSTGGAYVESVTYRFGDVELRNQHAAVLELRGLEKLYGMPLAGIVGYDFLSRFVIAIDYKNKWLTLYPRGHSTTAERGTHVSILMQGEQPYLDGSIRVGSRGIPNWFIL